MRRVSGRDGVSGARPKTGKPLVTQQPAKGSFRPPGVPREGRFDEAIRRLDAANGEDPHHVRCGGQDRPRELLYAERMTAWLERLEPGASEPLRLAVRAQHLQRWEIPRAQYPQGRAGYHRWRSALLRFHSERAAHILREVGVDEETIDRVQSLVRKERLKEDREAQVLEDVACLVFLEYEFAAFAEKHPEEKLLRIVRKTWRKMSDRGREEALRLPLEPRHRALVERALHPLP